MSKSPRKGSKVASSYNERMNNIGGKKIGAYNFSSHIPNYKQRSFSIVDSSTSSSDSEKTYKSKKNYKAQRSDSDSESSLTAVSENEDIKRHSKSRPSKRIHKSTKTYARKRTPRKTVDWKQHETLASSEDEETNYNSIPNRNENSSDSDSEESEDNYSSSDDSDVDFVKLQAERKAKSMKAIKSVHKIHKTKNNNYSDPELALESDSEVDISDLVAVSKSRKKSFSKLKGRSSMTQPKFGRRRSEAVLPDDINFTFEFGDSSKLDEDVIEEDDENTSFTENNVEKVQQQEEDIGEELTDFVKPTKKTTSTNDQNNNFSFDFDFDTQLIQVPKFKDDEINSDDDYEIDDNELLATLQADNGVDEFLGNDFSNSHTRNNSIGSYGDEEENDPFLKEEEKFLVDEFENNGFDDEGIDIEDYDLSESSNRNSLLDSFNNMNNSDSNQVLQYESSMESDSDKGAGDEEDEEDDYDEFIDFDVPLFDEEESDRNSKETKTNGSESSLIEPKKPSRQHHDHKKQHKRKRSNVGLNSDEDDDSYLWNYFFSSDNGSGSSEDEDIYRSADEVDKLNVEELFKDVENQQRNGRRHTLTAGGRKKLVSANQFHSNDSMNYEDNYDSGDSTDVDESLPASNKSKVGSKLAKEVLSSKTADYRPPVLGTWVAIDSKPFGIIDGLSTRSLQNNANKNMEPRSKARKGYNAPTNGTDDLALGLDELLNISELDDDDENDVQIWRDFNNQKKQVPLGAFRNKSVLQNSIIHPENVSSHYNHTTKSNNDFNQRRYSLSNHHPKKRNLISSKVKKPLAPRRNSSVSQSSGQIRLPTPTSAILSKLKRRRASIVEAVSEGLRPTKSGLFSEHALADVEEVLGDDNDLMALIKGL